MRRNEGGFVLAALLLFLIFAGAAIMLERRLAFDTSEARRQRITARSLAEARDALVTYAQIQHLFRPQGTAGEMPCPHMSLDNGREGSSDAPCGKKGAFAIGRLPYLTLGIPPLRDGYGECLWYGVAGTFKNSLPAGPITWDTGGQFSISKINGESLVPATAPRRQLAVAVIFSPGPPLNGQERGRPERQCNGNPKANLARNDFLDGNYVSATTIPSLIVAGDADSLVNNDKIVWITAEEVFSDRFVRRGDFVQFINKMLEDIWDKALAEAQNSLTIRELKPTDAIIVGTNIESGGFPKRIDSPLNDDEKGVNEILARYKSWADQFRYLRCIDGTQCLNNGKCKQVLMFAGQALSTQKRASASAGLDAYFEGDNLLALIDPTDSATQFSGPEKYEKDNATEDVIQCIN